MNSRSLFLLIIFFFSGAIMASPVTNMKKVGAAKLEMFFFDIYHSELYSDDGEYRKDDYPLALNINYLRNIKAKDLVERTEQEWQKLGYSAEQIAPWLKTVNELWPDIKKGDSLLLVVDQDLSSVFYFNGSEIGEISENTFGPSFLAIWLDENCSFPKLRQKLIGLSK
jgi:hypothetical protein